MASTPKKSSTTMTPSTATAAAAAASPAPPKTPTKGAKASASASASAASPGNGTPTKLPSPALWPTRRDLNEDYEPMPNWQYGDKPRPVWAVYGDKVYLFGSLQGGKQQVKLLDMKGSATHPRATEATFFGQKKQQQQQQDGAAAGTTAKKALNFDDIKEEKKTGEGTPKKRQPTKVKGKERAGEEKGSSDEENDAGSGSDTDSDYVDLAGGGVAKTTTKTTAKAGAKVKQEDDELELSPMEDDEDDDEGEGNGITATGTAKIDTTQAVKKLATQMAKQPDQGGEADVVGAQVDELVLLLGAFKISRGDDIKQVIKARANAL